MRKRDTGDIEAAEEVTRVSGGGGEGGGSGGAKGEMNQDRGGEVDRKRVG